MSNIETGGPAFPTEHTDTSGLFDGMTLRDYFAAKAMQGLLGGQWPDATDSKEIVRRSLILADLMLEARK